MIKTIFLALIYITTNNREIAAALVITNTYILYKGIILKAWIAAGLVQFHWNLALGFIFRMREVQTGYFSSSEGKSIQVAQTYKRMKILLFILLPRMQPWYFFRRVIGVVSEARRDERRGLVCQIVISCDTMTLFKSAAAAFSDK